MARDPRHVLMVADIDLGLPDARRVHVSEIARGLQAAGCEVELVSRGPDPRIDGVRYRAAAGSDSGRIARLARVNAVAIARAVARRRDARSLYARYDWGLLPTIVAGRALGYRVVLEVNALTSVDLDPNARLGLVLGARERVKRAAVGAAWRSSYRLLPVTERLRDALVDVFGAPAERVEIVTNGADTELFAPRDRAAAVRELGLDPADEHVLFVGLLAWWNDFPTVIEAFAQLLARRPRALLVFVGDGDEREAVEELVRARGISERVRFAGFVDDRSLVATYVAASRVCLSPGSTELAIGRPMKLAEYLAAGRAVVASAIPGISEMLAETGGGVTVAPHDPTAMAGALCDLLADPVAADALGLSARAAIVERYSWRAIASRLAAIFQ
jgi:glycosyltransferase involved in cell wall biosynthesis